MAKDSGGPDDGPEGPDKPARDCGQDQAWAGRREVPERPAAARVEGHGDGVAERIHEGLARRAWDLTAQLRDRDLPRCEGWGTPVEQKLGQAGILRDRGDLHLAIGDVRAGGQDLRKARKLSTEAVSLAEQDHGPLGDGQRLQAHGLAAVFAADALQPNSSEGHLRLARQSLAALEAHGEDGPAGGAASPWRLRLMEFELRAAEVRLDQANHPETVDQADPEGQWLRLKQIERRGDLRPWDPLWPPTSPGTPWRRPRRRRPPTRWRPTGGRPGTP